MYPNNFVIIDISYFGFFPFPSSKMLDKFFHRTANSVEPAYLTFKNYAQNQSLHLTITLKEITYI